MSKSLVLRIHEIKERLPVHYTQLFIDKFPKYKGKEQLIREVLCYRKMKNNQSLITALEKFVSNGK